jgi:hypothetical protein
MIPTVLKEGKYRFFFFSNEGTEPPHIHVESERNLEMMRRQWDEYFG